MPALLFLEMFYFLSCSPERIEAIAPPPPPTPAEGIAGLTICQKLEVQEDFHITNKPRGEDYLYNTLFYLNNIPDAHWQYTLELGGYLQVGIIDMINERAQISNQYREAYWLQSLEKNSITLHLRLYSDDFITVEHEDTFTFKNKRYKYELGKISNPCAAPYLVITTCKITNNIKPRLLVIKKQKIKIQNEMKRSFTNDNLEQYATKAVA